MLWSSSIVFYIRLFVNIFIEPEGVIRLLYFYILDEDKLLYNFIES